MKILIAGATGVFGRVLTRELLRNTDASVVLAARNVSDLPSGERIEARSVDLTRPAQVLEAARDCFAVACTAGPFQSLDASVPVQLSREGIHWVDIADDEDWVVPILRGEEAAGAGAIIPGASVTPCLSGILVRYLMPRLAEPESARTTLFIGNQNNKGAGAIASSFTSNFSNPTRVQLPYGSYTAWRFASPDRVLMKEELDLDAEFRVVFELGLVNWAVRASQPLRMLPDGARVGIARAFAKLSKPLQRFGTRRGCVQVELFDNKGNRAHAALLSTGQRLAILPCFIALRALLQNPNRLKGRVHPATWMSPDEWLDALSSASIDVR